MTAEQELYADEIGFRLASLADGEGCFYIGKLKNRHGNPAYNCAFFVKMRADDAPFLEHLSVMTGLGGIYEQGSTTADGHDRKPQVCWKIQTKTDCLALTMIFDRYKLWSKKQRDYEIWRKAVMEWNDHEPGDDWLPLEEFRDSLRAVREYA